MSRLAQERETKEVLQKQITNLQNSLSLERA
jgi:hypothetical protein